MNRRHIKPIVIAAAILLTAVGAQGQNFRKAIGIARDTINKANSTGRVQTPKGQVTEFSAEQIARKANFATYYQGESLKAQARMEIVDATGEKKICELSIKRLNVFVPNGTKQKVPGDQKYFFYIHQPPELAKTALLVWKNMGAADDRWFFSPAKNKVEPIAPGAARTNFAGSDFYYEDLTGREAHLDDHILLGEDADQRQYVIKSSPKATSGVVFAYYETLISRDTFLIVKRTYFDKAGKPYRTFEATRSNKIQGLATVTVSRITDLIRKRYTEISLEQVSYNTQIDKTTFQQSALPKPKLKQPQGE